MTEESDVFLEGEHILAQNYTPTIPNLISDMNIELLFDQSKLDSINADETASKVFIIGMPSDIGVRAFDGRAGAERGPESFREMATLCAMPNNPVSSVTALLNRVKVYDCGSIYVNQGKAIEHKDMTKEEAGAKLASVIAQILSKVERSRVFVVGGSDELNLHLMHGLSEARIGEFKVLHLDPSLDVKPTHMRQVDEEEPTYHETNQSYLRRLFTDEVRLEGLKEMAFVGVQGHRVTQSEVDMVKACAAFKTSIVYFKRGEMEPTSGTLYSGRQLVSIDFSCVKSHFAPGVGIPSPAMGFTDVQIC